jgi:hypothetical protein
MKLREYFIKGKNRVTKLNNNSFLKYLKKSVVEELVFFAFLIRLQESEGEIAI